MAILTTLLPERIYMENFEKDNKRDTVYGEG